METVIIWLSIDLLAALVAAMGWRIRKMEHRAAETDRALTASAKSTQEAVDAFRAKLEAMAHDMYERLDALEPGKAEPDPDFAAGVAAILSYDPIQAHRAAEAARNRGNSE